MTVPTAIVGAWRRSGLIWNGARQVDYCDAVWLQTPEWFADIRTLIDRGVVPEKRAVPSFFDKEFSFAGVATWDEPQITWEHLIDSNQHSGLDSNPLTWENGVVFETGHATVDGEEGTFIEEWLRMTDDSVKWSAEPGERRARVEVGAWAIEVVDDRPSGGFTATRYDLTPNGWAPFGSVTA
jgi:hypothetical protein